MAKLIGVRTTKKGKLDRARWGWRAVSFFDGQERLPSGVPERRDIQEALV